jgi:hypothetical protein
VELDQYVGIDSSVAYFKALDSSVCYKQAKKKRYSFCFTPASALVYPHKIGEVFRDWTFSQSESASSCNQYISIPMHSISGARSTTKISDSEKDGLCLIILYIYI